MIEIDAEIEGNSWSQVNFFSEAEEKWTLSFVVKVEDTIIGFAIISKKTEACCHLHRIAISRGLQGRGYGKIMVQEIFSIVRFKRARYLSLKVPMYNMKAFLFYKALGFEELLSQDNHFFMVSPFLGDIHR